MSNHDNGNAEVLKRLIREEEAKLTIEDREVIQKALWAARILMDEEDFLVKTEGMKLWLQTRVFMKLDRLERGGAD